MARYRLTIAYDGTEFHGWQRQHAPASHIEGKGEPRLVEPLPGEPVRRSDDEADGGSRGARIELRTVQRILERTVWEVLREPVSVRGASRTDSGVHAKAQTGAFSVRDDRRGPEDDRLAMALNARLPDDVVIRSCVRTREDFDPISDCLAKGYRYTILAGRERPLWDRRYVTHVPVALATDLMREAAGLIVGTHDFAAFTNAGHGRESTVRRVDACSVEDVSVDAPCAQRIAIDVAGPGFLYNMVRIIAGTLVEVGKGRLSVEDVRIAIETGDRRRSGPTMPPEGLCLEWMRYPDDAEHPPGAGALR